MNDLSLLFFGYFPAISLIRFFPVLHRERTTWGLAVGTEQASVASPRPLAQAVRGRFVAQDSLLQLGGGEEQGRSDYGARHTVSGGRFECGGKWWITKFVRFSLQKALSRAVSDAERCDSRRCQGHTENLPAAVRGRGRDSPNRARRASARARCRAGKCGMEIG